MNTGVPQWYRHRHTGIAIFLGHSYLVLHSSYHGKHPEECGDKPIRKSEEPKRKRFGKTQDLLNSQNTDNFARTGCY